ncbi:IS1595 family transposase [Janthinobacterium sp.]|uniref:IS1595 family transposase n=1 Tax=Janthinobacterium sp. TaxID=1871054 RepID=UPI0028997BC5|nr:IS1595 family transposase [Janthinobacterium sp.]
MQSDQWQAFIAQFAQLSHRQRKASADLLRNGAQQETVICLIEQAAQAQLHCPACNSFHFYRHGHEHGLQRYRCVPCGRTFNALSGTPLAHLRYKARWLAYADCLLGSFSIRKAAEHLNIHRNTSFRWRHRFLALAKSDRPRCLHGIAEADEMYMLESQKGSRHLTRPARRRAGRARQRGISNEQVCVLLARDSTGQTVDFVTGLGQLTKARLHACLPPVIDRDILLVTDGHPAYPVFARELGIMHEAVNLRASIRVRGTVHVQNVNAYRSRFRSWLSAFHGVATRYLPNYLGWRWILDARRILSPESLLKATLGDFPHMTVT